MKSFSITATNFNLGHTLECGQVFRWDAIGPSEYEGVVEGSAVRVKQIRSRFFISSSSSRITPSFIKSYFDLTLDLAYIYNKICKDKHIRAFVKRFKGLRIIRQPLWECTASFILSSYNNIPRIKGIIQNLSKYLGRPIPVDGEVNYSFPAPRVIARLDLCRLKDCGMGFRAPYLKGAAAAFLSGKITLQRLRRLPYDEAKGLLMGLDGVGDKVADCILLYSAHRFEAFPVDVWIKRIIERLYFGSKTVGEKVIRCFGQEYFGEYAGYAQQYLYHYARTIL